MAKIEQLIPFTPEEVRRTISTLKKAEKHTKQVMAVESFVEVLEEHLKQRHHETSNVTEGKLVLEFVIESLKDILKKE